MPRWAGVDVGGSRKGFDMAVVDEHGVVALEGRLDRAAVKALVKKHAPAVVAIDSPSTTAPAGQASRASERALVAAGICNIRWTPDLARVQVGDYYAWIREGLKLYGDLEELPSAVIECFPTASWTRWESRRGARRRSAWSRHVLNMLALEGVPSRTNQDQRDAIAAAVTAREYARGRTETFGGEIVVPRT